MKIVLSQLKKGGIFILAKGELEDYFTNQAMDLATNSKDLRAMAVAKKLSECSVPEEMSQWVDYNEFEEMLRDVHQRIRPLTETATQILDNIESQNSHFPSDESSSYFSSDDLYEEIPF